jgi:hypothetical protein
MTHELERGERTNFVTLGETLEVSEAAVLRDWRAAKAWLAHTLRR